jgi:hypothetical protein
MTANEQAYCKITLFLLTDWDSFQMVMRGSLRRMERKETAQSATNKDKCITLLNCIASDSLFVENWEADK